jgi:hypothetical protein
MAAAVVTGVVHKKTGTSANSQLFLRLQIYGLSAGKLKVKSQNYTGGDCQRSFGFIGSWNFTKAFIINDYYVR